MTDMGTDMKRNDETATAFTLRRMINEVIDQCAEIAQTSGSQMGEPAIGYQIAKAIRALAHR